MNYYRNTIFAFALICVIAVCAMAAATGWRKEQRKRCDSSLAEATRLAQTKRTADEKLRLREVAQKPLQKFADVWQPFRRPAPTKDLGNHLRNALATLATQTGLTAEGTTVPGEPRAYSVGADAIKVQQISMDVISESLPALLTWLGQIEGRFAYARVESLSLSSYASHSVQLSITLLQPIEEEMSATGENPATSFVRSK